MGSEVLEIRTYYRIGSRSLYNRVTLSDPYKTFYF